MESSMKKTIIGLLMPASLGAGALAGPEQATLLEPGEYKVTVRLELPHIEDTNIESTQENICVTAGDAGTHGLGPLSERNPLRKCPLSNVRQDGDTLTFNIVCPGNDAAVGAAKYTMRAEHFDGAIAVKMGGKNMTMIERHSGQRVGSCS